MMGQIGDSLKAFGEKTADLFKTDLTPHQIEEKANQEMHDAALAEKRDSVLSQFVKVKDGLYVDKQLDQAQFQGDIQRVYPTGRVFTRAEEAPPLHEPAGLTAESVIGTVDEGLLNPN